MAKYVLYYGLSILFDIVLRCVAQDVEFTACSNPSITYAPSGTAYEYRSTTNALLTCGLETSTPRWWVSTDPCGPFTNSTLCPERQNFCQFSITDAKDNLYHCCTTDGNVEDSVGDIAHLHCMLLRVCTSVDPMHSSLPPIAFFGLNLVLYVAVYSSPKPSSSLMVQLRRNNISLFGKIIQHSLLPPPLLVYEFNVLMPKADEVDSNFSIITVKFSSPNDLNCAGTRTVTHYVPVKTREIPTSSTITSATGTSAVSMSTPTGLGLNKHCHISDWIIAFIAGLAVLAFILVVLLVTSVLCGNTFYRRWKESDLQAVQYNHINDGISCRNPIQSPSSPSSNTGIVDAAHPIYQRISTTNSLSTSHNNIVAETPPPQYRETTPTHSTNTTTQLIPPLPGSTTYHQSTPTHHQPPTPVTRSHPNELSIASESHGRHSGLTPLIEFTPDQPPTSGQDPFLSHLACPRPELATSGAQLSKGCDVASSNGGCGGVANSSISSGVSDGVCGGGDTANGAIGSGFSGGGDTANGTIGSGFSGGSDTANGAISSGFSGASGVSVNSDCNLYSCKTIRDEASKVNLNLDSPSRDI